MKIQYLQNKRIRAKLLRELYGNTPMYCFSCGNASKALEEVGANIEHIKSEIYIGLEEQMKRFYGVNVTSGCLPITMMERLSLIYATKIKDDGGKFYVPCGSGETLFALSFFIPASRLVAVTANYAPVQFDAMTPLYLWITKNIDCLHVGEVKGIKEMATHLSDFKGTFIDTSGQGLVYNE